MCTEGNEAAHNGARTQDEEGRSMATEAVLVRDQRTKMHALVRPVAPAEIDVLAPAVTVEQFNALMMAKTPAALCDAIDAIGPLRRMRSDMGSGKERLLLTSKEALSLVEDGSFARADADALLDECLLDPFVRLSDAATFVREGRRPLGEARRAVEERSPDRLGDLLATAGDGALVEVEPLRDWLLARNLISVAARLAGLTRVSAAYEGGSGTLERAGFVEVSRTTLISRLTLVTPRAWVLPLLFNTWYREGNLIANDADYPAGLIEPLFERLTETVSHYLGLRRTRVLKGAKEVAFLSATSANVTQGSSIVRDRRPEEDRWVYLTLQGDDQDALALALLRALDSLLGVRMVSYTGYESQGLPIGYRDAPAALWETLLRHERHFLVTCKQCGRTVLSTKQGPPREFCSDACRSLFSRNIKEPFLR